MEDTFRTAIIGFGVHAKRSHLPFLNVVALCDPLAEHDTIKVFRDEAALYEWNEFDGVYIGSPDRFHFPQMLEAVKHGKHVLVEKPLVSTEADLAKLAEVLLKAKASGVVVTSCHPRRFDPPYLAIKTGFTKWQNELGELIHVEMDFMYHVARGISLHNSLKADHANHELDFLNYLLGHSPTVENELSTEQDRYVLSGVRSDGVTFLFLGTRLSSDVVYNEVVRLRFAQGEVLANCHTGEIRITRNHELLRTESLPPTNYDKRFSDLNESWEQACLGKEENYLTIDELVANSAISL